jgi:hypothetical protein
VKIRRVRVLRAAARLAGAVLAMFVAGHVASIVTFPMGGGEYHAMFAYSDGNLAAAYLAFRVHVGTVCAVAALLVARGCRVPWAVLALAATAIAGRYWWSVYTWGGQRPEFHRVAGLLLLAIPVIAFAACGAAHALRRRMRVKSAAQPRVVEPAG